MTISARTKIVSGRNGFTLAEALMAAVVLAIAAAGVLLPFAGGAAVQAEGRNRTLAAKLAADFMEQVINTPFEDIVATYDGYCETPGQLIDVTGAVFTDSGYAYFSREAGCQYVYMVQQAGTAQPTFIRAVVRVYYRGNKLAEIVRLIGQ